MAATPSSRKKQVWFIACHEEGVSYVLGSMSPPIGSSRSCLELTEGNSRGNHRHPPCGVIRPRKLAPGFSPWKQQFQLLHLSVAA